MEYKAWAKTGPIVVASALMTVGCGGSDKKDDPVVIDPPPPVTTVALKGRVSDGEAIEGAAITYTCDAETSATETGHSSAADGTFQIQVPQDYTICQVTASYDGFTLSSVSNEVGQYVNINPVTDLITETVLAAPDGIVRQAKNSDGATKARRSLSEVTASLFDTQGQTVVDQVFSGGFNFATDFNTESTGTDGSNLADTLFRSVDATVGGLSDLTSTIRQANDTGASFLTDPAFQAVVATEVVAVSSGTGASELDSAISALPVADNINSVRTVVTDLVQNAADTSSAARLAGSVLKVALNNATPGESFSLATVAQNVTTIAGPNILSLAEATTELAEATVIGSQIGSTLAKATDLNQPVADADVAKLTTIADNTKTVVETTIASTNSNLSDRNKAEFLDQLASAAVDFVIANDTNFIAAPDLTNTAALTTVAQNTATTFNGLANILEQQNVDTSVLESVFANAAQTTVANVSSFISSEESGELFTNVGANVSAVTTGLMTQVATTASSAKETLVASSAIASTLNSATIDFSAETIATDVIEELNTTAQTVSTNVTAAVADLSSANVSNNVLNVVVQSASVRTAEAVVSGDVVDASVAAQQGAAQMVTSLTTLAESGFDTDALAAQLISNDVDVDRLATTVEILETTFANSENTDAGENSLDIIAATVETAANASDEAFETDVATVTEVLDQTLSAGGDINTVADAIVSSDLLTSLEEALEEALQDTGIVIDFEEINNQVEETVANANDSIENQDPDVDFGEVDLGGDTTGAEGEGQGPSTPGTGNGG